LVDDAEPLDADLLDPWSHCPLPSLARLRSTAPRPEHVCACDPTRSFPQFTQGRTLPRQPWTGSSNLATSLSVNGAPVLSTPCSRASRTGSAPRRTSTRLPEGRSKRRRPSHHSTPPGVSGRISTASVERGETTSGRASRAGALIGTRSSAATSGHTTGPPAEKA